MIMPGSLPLYDGSTRNELMYYLPAGWEPVVEKDIDSERAGNDPNWRAEGRVQQAVECSQSRGAHDLPGERTRFSVHEGRHPQYDRPRVLLGCLQPGQTSSTYSGTLNRLADRAPLSEKLRRN